MIRSVISLREIKERTESSSLANDESSSHLSEAVQ